MAHVLKNEMPHRAISPDFGIRANVPFGTQPETGSVDGLILIFGQKLGKMGAKMALIYL